MGKLYAPGQVYVYLQVQNAVVFKWGGGKVIISFWLSQFVSFSVKVSHSPTSRGGICVPGRLSVVVVVCLCANWFMLSRFARMWLLSCVSCYFCPLSKPTEREMSQSLKPDWLDRDFLTSQSSCPAHTSTRRSCG